MSIPKVQKSKSSTHDDSSDHSYGSSDVYGGEAEMEKNNNKEQEDEIAKDETKAVWRLKLLVLFVLVASTIGVAVAVYYYVHNTETSEFESQFKDDSDKVLEAIGSTLDVTLGAVDSFVVGLVSFAKYANDTWPFVTLPDYAVRGAKLRSLSKAFIVNQYQYVKPGQKEAWQNYSVANEDWVANGIEVQAEDENYKGVIITNYTTSPVIYGSWDDSPQPGPYLPKWQSSPVVPRYPPYNWDAFTLPLLKRALEVVLSSRRVVMSESYNLWNFSDPDQVRLAKGTSNWIIDYLAPDDDPTEPASDFYYPMIDNVDSVKIWSTDQNASDPSLPPVVGVFSLSIFWRELIRDILPPGSNGIHVVFGNTCNQTFTYMLHGPKTVYLGPGDHHEPAYDYLEKRTWFYDLGNYAISKRTYEGLPLNEDFCPMWIRVYPSSIMMDHYVTNRPAIFTASAVLIFLFTSVVFLLYDCLVERRQKKVMTTAVQSSAIVSSLFPSVVRDRLYPVTQESKVEKNTFKSKVTQGPKMRLKSYLSDPNAVTTDGNQDAGETSTSRPIADLFPETTVLFADIAGFTAWSSVREPRLVFTLLETLYGAFDKIARRRGVFKVETIGDSYVAVTGLPEPRDDHAIVMVRFARDCREKMNELTKKLEMTLGPDTGDLSMRFGLHSGPVTAGVLRGEKSRFQLFGDTVNTAARMESNGMRNKIHVSQKTADLLIADGKAHWVTAREGMIEAKGKGKMQTFWVEPHSHNSAGGSVYSTSDTSTDGVAEALDDRTKRLVDWNYEVLHRLLRHVIANRNRDEIKPLSSGIDFGKAATKTVIDEVAEIIEIPDGRPSHVRVDEDDVKLEPQVEEQLRQLVSTIASSYNNNPFHCFEHASHVAMSMETLLSRIVAPTQGEGGFGITSDPLIQLAFVFACLIHDVDHPGVPNAQLVKENTRTAQFYKGRSIAEQNSMDIAWAIFMDERFCELRSAFFGNDNDLLRFRQLVVNAVIATDLFDRDLMVSRENRWERAFHEERADGENALHNKASIVLEHIMQACDIAHTMQHWSIFEKWNQRLFEEVYIAYTNGRGEQDPAEYWYTSEIAFFDQFVIPLATKLKECGALGGNGEEYLDLATKNCEEWKARGNEVVASTVQNIRNRASNKHN